MNLTFRYYTDEDFLRIQELVIRSYQWSYPSWGLSRHQFCRGLHPAFRGTPNNWRHTTGLWEEEGRLAACVISEGVYEGDAFFLFDTEERGKDRDLLDRMFRHAETHLAAWSDDRKTLRLDLLVPEGNRLLEEEAGSRGYMKTEQTDRGLVLSFPKEPYPVELPDGYRIADGRTVPDFYLSLVHRSAFQYGLPMAESGEQAFHDLRTMPGYRADLDLTVLDPDGKPVGMAIIWYDERIPYCELEPLGVAWWCRRKGIARALIYEAANRVRAQGPCRALLGGDQAFYWDLGFEVKATDTIWRKTRTV